MHSQDIKLSRVIMVMALDIQTLNAYQKDKLIRKQSHPTFPLYIWNYTEVCQFTKAWDEITNRCRGLITDQDGKIIARSFNKFHNIEEARHQATDDFIVQDKLDGSLAILFHYDNEWRIASRGSFVSEQAVKAKEILDQNYSTQQLDPKKSYIFEIIYPENRIVVDYKDEEKLVYLASFLPSGEEFFEEDLMRSSGFPVVTVHDGLDYKTIKDLNWHNAEGFVVKFSNGTRCKVKFESYINLHKIVTNLSVLGVWNWFKTGQPMTDFTKEVPDEWFEWLKETWDDLKSKKQKIEDEIQNRLQELADKTDRREFAKSIQDYRYKSMLFALRDGKDVHKMICDQIRPTNVQLGVAPRISKSVKKVEPQQKVGKLMILSGISASGKSSWAAQYVHKHPEAVIVSRDAIRLLLWGCNDQKYHRHPRASEREAKVTSIQHKLIQQLLDQGNEVLIDDTNVSLSVINTLCKNFADYQITFKRFEVTAEDAVERDSKRTRTVGKDVINEQMAKLNILSKTFDFANREPFNPQTIASNQKAKPAYIFDLDGTLCENVTGRSPYDWARVGEDHIRQMVKTCAIALAKHGFEIIICTGRDACCKQITEKWLSDNEISYAELHMRPEKDQRADWKVKEEMWQDIASRYHIQALFDDRQQVVDHGRRLGLEVFQVAPGNF